MHGAGRGLLVLLPDLVRDGRDVVPRITLAEGVEVVLAVAGVGLEELLEEVVHVGADLRLVVVEAEAV